MAVRDGFPFDVPREKAPHRLRQETALGEESNVGHGGALDRARPHFSFGLQFVRRCRPDSSVGRCLQRICSVQEGHVTLLSFGECLRV